MKIITILIFLVFKFNSVEKNVNKVTLKKIESEISYQNKFNKTQLDFIKSRSLDDIYYIKENDILIAYNHAYLEFLSKSTISSFELDTYSESNLKFDIINKRNRKLGKVLLENDNNTNEEMIYIILNNKKIIRQFGASEFLLSSKNKLKK